MRRLSARLSLVPLFFVAVVSAGGSGAFAFGGLLGEEKISVTAPNAEQAARLFAVTPPLRILREEGATPSGPASSGQVPQRPSAPESPV